MLGMGNDGADTDVLVAVAATGAALASMSPSAARTVDREVELVARRVVMAAWSDWSFALPPSFRARRLHCEVGQLGPDGLCRCIGLDPVFPAELIEAVGSVTEWVLVRDVAGQPPAARVWRIDDPPIRAFLPVATPEIEVSAEEVLAALWTALDEATASRRLPGRWSSVTWRRSFVDRLLRVLHRSGWILCELPPDYDADWRESN
jgi:hypothetical protein